ncbi:AI-2E family transporter [Azospirillum sp.]|uniref:AI-2E family transporter n=1 Tax=Azospirillum sp. TaxID=34012 RepID=UPI003D729858
MAKDTASTLQARPIRVAPAAPRSDPRTTLLLVALVVAALYVGRDLLVPLALSVLLAFVLTPIVGRLERWGLKRVPSVIAVTALLFVAIAGFGTVVGTQVADLAQNLPAYQRNIEAKIRSLQSSATQGGVLREASQMIRDLRAELEQAGRQAQTPAPSGAPPAAPAAAPTVGPPRPAAEPPRPVPVLVQPPDPSPLDVVSGVLGPVLGPLATAGMVLVFVIFMLLQREDLRDRLIRLAGSGDLSRTTEAMNDAAERVARYLLMQVVVNVTYGIPIGVGLALIGVPNPILWGMLATVLRFIPFAGPAIAASFPILLSLAVAPGWMMPVLTIALFVAVELVSNNVVEPWLYGSATGLSSVAIIVAAVFWTTLWGPVGLLLATPLTVCLVVLGRHVPALNFLEVMLGDRPVLPVEAKIYQRLLARDPEEAVEILEGELATRSVPEVYDAVLLPALSLAEQDRARATLGPEGRQAVAAGFAEVLEALAEVGEPGPPIAEGSPSVLCVAARNDLDEAAAGLLADLLRRRGTAATVLPCERVGPRAVGALGTAGVAALAVSYLNPSALPHARRLVRRLRLHFGPNAPILLCLWSAHPEADATPRATAETAADRVATNTHGALAHLEELGLVAPETPEEEARKAG